MSGPRLEPLERAPETGAYLFLKLTDPSQPDPVLCNLYKNVSGPAVL